MAPGWTMVWNIMVEADVDQLWRREGEQRMGNEI